MYKSQCEWFNQSRKKYLYSFSSLTQACKNISNIILYSNKIAYSLMQCNGSDNHRKTQFYSKKALTNGFTISTKSMVLVNETPI